jgi:transposase-like protein
MRKRKQYSAAFKTKVVLEALKEEKTVAQLASEYEIHATMIHAWKREFLENASSIFEDKRKNKEPRDQEQLTEHLYKQIGQLKVENDFLHRACDKLGLKPGEDASR